MAISGESRSAPFLEHYDGIWWSLDGSFLFEDKIISGVYDPVTGDFDGDGNLDIYWYGPGRNYDVMWWSYGDGGFDEAPEFRLDDVYEILVGDFDGDENDDLFWYNSQDDIKDYIVWSDGDRTFTFEEATIYGSFEPFVGDFNGDGNDDIFWYRPGSDADFIDWFDDNRSFVREVLSVRGDYTPLVGNFDGDNGDDILWYRSGTDYIWWSDGDRTFTYQTKSVSGKNLAFTGNFDGRNGDDIVLYHPEDNNYFWFSDGDRTFTISREFRNGSNKTLIGDFDNNSQDDMFLYGSGNTECDIPGYDPYIWNDKDRGGSIQVNNNCYNYATNTVTNDNAQPGIGSGEKFFLHQCEDIWNAAIRDGLTPLPSGRVCPPTMTTVALAVMPGDDDKGDYHWYRLDNDGIWSHKLADAPAKRTDYSGNLIFNPELADRSPYHEFCGYMCVCSSARQGEGNANIKGKDVDN